MWQVSCPLQTLPSSHCASVVHVPLPPSPASTGTPASGMLVIETQRPP
jgi:hypothetical protein